MSSLASVASKLRLDLASRQLQLACCHSAASSAPPAPGGPVKKGVIYKRIPTFVQLEGGKKYSWCACGLSKKQPFCDGSHKGKDLGVGPVHFTVDATKKYLLCRCKQTNNRPFCDLTHVKTFIPESIRSSLKIKL
uniref:Putative cdgsh iron sulfur domain-containing protein 3 n=1 Tax=Ixodes ricinus TaxID=34613 RepID=A0A0K8RB36_IXORI